MLELLRAEFKRTWTLYVRYPMDSLTGLSIMFITFYMLIQGAQYIAGPVRIGARLDGIILGYWLWNMAILSFSFTATSIQQEAMAGTLEQLFLSPFGAVRLFLARVIASISINVGTSSALLLVLLLITGRRLAFPPLTAIPLLTLLITTYGVGFAISGLTLLFKRTQQLMTIVQFLFLPLVMMPVEAWSRSPIVPHLFPVISSASLLRSLMTRDVSPSATSFLLAIANSVAYFALGIGLFHIAERQARSRGLLGQY